ncbi:MAG: symmetrical bis(5'-nucleosyl)-tetraphosphatase [Arenicella sp.]
MTDYVVGDIQGCYATLIALLDKANFNPTQDTLFCVGDLVNRGPDSLETLRFIRSLGTSAKTVLGNHDLHLISVYFGCKEQKNLDTLQDIIVAPDAEELIYWLKSQPLMIFEPKKKCIISHAGIYPLWDVEKSLGYADEISTALQSKKFITVLKKMYGNTPDKYKPDAKRFARYRFTINAFTRMRYCTKNGKFNFDEKGSPKSYKGKLKPWFQLDRKIPYDIRLIFGHWSSLGRYNSNNIIGIDTGCVWGNKLTLYDIDNDRFISKKSQEN